MQDIDALIKRVEQIEKRQKRIVSDFNKALSKSILSALIETYQYVTRGIKNEHDLTILTEYLIDNDIVRDLPRYLEYKNEHKLTKTFRDESQNALDVRNYYISQLENPGAPLDYSKIHYFNDFLNHIIWKRLLLFKELLIERELPEDSEYVKKIEKQITDIAQIMNSDENEDSKDTKDFIKKKEARQIFGDIISKKEEIIKRMRELPLFSDVNLELNTKMIYGEVLHNYWFGQFNASICLLSVFLEGFLRDVYYFKENEHYNKTLVQLINICKNKKIITQEEQRYLLDFADKVRNKYLHRRIEEIIPNVVTAGVKLSFGDTPTESDLTYLTADTLPPLRDMVKENVDKKLSKDLIINIGECIKIISERTYSYGYEKIDS